MGRKNKGLGTLVGTVAGTAIGGPAGAGIGASLGGVLDASGPGEKANQIPLIDKMVTDKLYNQAVGNQITTGELKANQMYDKTLAQQIAAAATARGVNPGLLQRNVARIAAEQSQKNAQDAAILAAEERNNALTKYLQAQQINASIAKENLDSQNAKDKANDYAKGAAFQGLAGSLVNYGMSRDAAKQKMDSDLAAAESTPMSSDELKYGNAASGSISGDASGFVQDPYAMNARTPGRYDQVAMADAMSDKSKKTKIKKESMYAVSDERQKDLIKTEDLPQNANLSQQNMQAVQPQPQPQMQAPVAQQPVQQAQAPQAPPKQVPIGGTGITAEMLQKARESSKGGGNVADITNTANTQAMVPTNPDEATQRALLDWSIRRFGQNSNKYQQTLGDYNAQQDAKRADYLREQQDVDAANMLKNTERTARLNKFYTGITTGNQGAVASQFGPTTTAIAPNIAEAIARYRPGMVTNSFLMRSDEDVKENKKSEDSVSGEDFNPKSFLDKLQAYSYEYKESQKNDPKAGDGRHLSVMAQDLEKAGPVGKSMVKQDEDGTKMVDYGKGFGAILASQAHLNERLSQIEKMYSKKKG
jgi:Chaperone of endosialidase